MPIGAFKLNGISRYLAPTGPTPNTWSTYSYNSALTSISRYTGVTNDTIAFHGIQNNGNLVMIIGTLNSARTANSLYPAVLNLNTGAFAIGSAISVGNSYPTGTPYISCGVDGDGSIGMLSATTVVGTAWRAYVRGYTISNWGSCSTTTLPTLTLSTAYTKGTDGSGPLIGYLGNSRFGVATRDTAVGDIACMDVFTHNGSSAPTLYKAGVAGGARASGRPIGIKAGISSTNYAAYYWMVGNNNNYIIPQYYQGNASVMNQYNNDGNLGAVVGNSFNGNIVNDISGSVIAINQIRNGSAENRISISKWTNANTPTSAPSVTTSSTYQTAYGPFGGFMPIGNKTSSQIYVPVYVNASTTRFDILNINTTSLAISSQTTGVTATSPYTGDMYFSNFYDSTYGQWLIAISFISGTSAVNLHFSKWNP